MTARLLACALAAAVPVVGQRVAANIASPNYVWLYEYPLPIPPTAQASYSIESSGTQVDYYELDISAFTTQIYPNLGPAYAIGFNATSPGPTFRVKRGTETIVRVTNNGNYTAATHLHGSWTRSPWDGWADDLVPIGSFKDYYYPNTQSSRTLWYHDHADGHTAVDAYYGQNGFYILEDDDDPALPSGQYDVVLAISDAIYQTNGDLASPSSATVNWFGDTVQVNGRPWPYLSVEPRKYRFRVLDVSLSRPYELYISDDSSQQQVDMVVVATDGGFVQTPISTQTLQISCGERYEIIVDFAQYAGQNLTMGNSLNLEGIQNYENTDKVMRFAVGQSVSDSSNNDIPGSINVELPPQPASRDDVDHVFNFQRTNNEWTINGVDYNEPESRVLARPPQGTVENWQLRYASGPGVHPIHVHLVDFKVVSRSGGSRGVLPYESAGMKDVVLLDPGEVVNVVAWYGPWNGQYVFHCHNLIHEDDNMMDVFNATFLEELGYADWAAFDDPMDSRFAPTPSAASFYDAQSITATLMPSLVGLNAYQNESQVTSLLAAIYSTRPYGEPSAAFSSATADPTSIMTTVVGNDASYGPGDGGYYTNVPFTYGSWVPNGGRPNGGPPGYYGHDHHPRTLSATDAAPSSVITEPPYISQSFWA